MTTAEAAKILNKCGYVVLRVDGGWNVEGQNRTDAELIAWAERMKKVAEVAPVGDGANEEYQRILREIDELRKTQPRPLAKLFGSNGPTPEQKAKWEADTKAHNSKMGKLRRQLPALLQKANEEFRATRATDSFTDTSHKHLYTVTNKNGTVHVSGNSAAHALRRLKESRPDEPANHAHHVASSYKGSWRTPMVRVLPREQGTWGEVPIAEWPPYSITDRAKGAMDIQPVGKPQYNAEAVQKEINKDKRIGGKESKAIHRLLQGRGKDRTRLHAALDKVLNAQNSPAEEEAINKVYALIRRHDPALESKLSRKEVWQNIKAGRKPEDIADEFLNEFGNRVLDAEGRATPAKNVKRGMRFTTAKYGENNSKVHTVSDVRFDKVKKDSTKQSRYTDSVTLFVEGGKMYYYSPDETVQVVTGASDAENKVIAPIPTFVPRSKRPSAKDATKYPQSALSMLAKGEPASKVSKETGVPVSVLAEVLRKSKTSGLFAYPEGYAELHGKDASPFDRDTDFGCAQITLRESKSGSSPEDIVKKYGFDLRFVKDVLTGKYGKSDAELKKNLGGKVDDLKPVGDAAVCEYCEESPCVCKCPHGKKPATCKQCKKEGWGEPYER